MQTIIDAPRKELSPYAPKIEMFNIDPEKIKDNAKEFISTLIKLKPATAKGTYLKSIYLSSTMSSGLKIDPKSIEE